MCFFVDVAVAHDEVEASVLARFDADDAEDENGDDDDSDNDIDKEDVGIVLETHEEIDDDLDTGRSETPEGVVPG